MGNSRLAMARGVGHGGDMPSRPIRQYWRTVVSRAWHDTIHVFHPDKRRLALVPLLFLIGSAVHYVREGAEAVTGELTVALSYGVYAVVIVGIGLFFYNLLASPARLHSEIAAERDALLATLSESPLQIIFPDEANMASKVTEFRLVTDYLAQNGDDMTPPFPSRHRFFIGIFNTSTSTVRNVGLRIVSGGIPDGPLDLRLAAKTNKASMIDIAPGTWERFIFGEATRCKASDFVGEIRPRPVNQPAAMIQETNKLGKHIGLTIYAANAKLPLLRNDGHKLRVIAHGDDVVPAYAEITLNMKNEISIKVRPIDSLNA